MPSIQVSYDAFRYSLEQFGLYYTDDEFNRLLPFADPDKTGSFRYVDNTRINTFIKIKHANDATIQLRLMS